VAKIFSSNVVFDSIYEIADQEKESSEEAVFHDECSNFSADFFKFRRSSSLSSFMEPSSSLPTPRANGKTKKLLFPVVTSAIIAVNSKEVQKTRAKTKVSRNKNFTKCCNLTFITGENKTRRNIGKDKVRIDHGNKACESSSVANSAHWNDECSSKITETRTNNPGTIVGIISQFKEAVNLLIQTIFKSIWNGSICIHRQSGKSRVMNDRNPHFAAADQLTKYRYELWSRD
jgi:hypothetical protein